MWYLSSLMERKLRSTQKERAMLVVKLRDKTKTEKIEATLPKNKNIPNAFCEKTKMRLGGTSEWTEGILVGQQSNLLADVGRKKARETEN